MNRLGLCVVIIAALSAISFPVGALMLGSAPSVDAIPTDIKESVDATGPGPALSPEGKSIPRSARSLAPTRMSPMAAARLTLYDVEHFFAPNDLKRYSLGTKNKTLVANADGSLTIYVQAGPPPEAQRANWLPAPKDADFSLFLRAYWPKTAIIDGSWTPPAVMKADRPSDRSETTQVQKTGIEGEQDAWKQLSVSTCPA